MKILILMLMSLSLHASEQAMINAFYDLNTCGNFTERQGDWIIIGEGPYRRWMEEPRSPIPSILKMKNFKTGERRNLEIEDSATRAIIEGESLFVLTYDGIEKWDLKTNSKVAKWKTSHFDQRELRYKEHPTDMLIYQGKVYLSHGRQGLTVLDATSGEFLKQINPLGDQVPFESQATAIGRIGSNIILIWDNFSLSRPGKKKAFRGFTVYDTLKSEFSIIRGPLDPGNVSLNIDQQKMYVGFSGIFHEYDFRKLSSRRRLRADKLHYAFPDRAKPYRRSLITESNVIGCWSFPGDGVVKRVPYVFNRKEILP